jgi:hypothetical protein
MNMLPAQDFVKTFLVGTIKKIIPCCIYENFKKH